MNQTTWAIQVLKDSKKGAIEAKNLLWLRQNLKGFKVSVCSEDCIVKASDISEKWADKGIIFIQDGKKVNFKNEFNPEKEALLLIKYESEKTYMIFLYSPKE